MMKAMTVGLVAAFNRQYGGVHNGVFVWQRLDGNHTIQEILSEIMDTYRDVPPEAENHLREFVNNLLQHGLAGYEYQS